MDAIGTIPDKIVIFLSAPEKVSLAEQPDIDDDGNKIPEEAKQKEEVFPAFAVPSDSTSSLKTAQSWAEKRAKEGHYDHTARQFVLKKEWPVQKIERDNKPFKGLRIAGLEHRGNGGRAYKVVTDEKHYFDLREEVLVDIMRFAGIKKGAALNGKYVWGRVGTQMKLILVGTKLYHNLINGSRLRKLPLIDPKNFVPGAVYTDVKLQKAMFIGNCSTLSLAASNNQLSGRKIKSKLFYRLYSFDHADNNFDPKVGYRFLFKDKFNFVEKVDQVKLPDNVFEVIRLEALKKLEEDLVAHRVRLEEDRNRPRPSWMGMSSGPSSDESSIYAYASMLCNLEGEGETIELPKEFAQYASKISG